MKLFVSYAHKNIFQVKQIIEFLESANHIVQWDTHLLPGQNWKQALSRAILSSDAFVYVLTPHSIESEWCQWEFARAVEAGKPVLPILAEPGTPIPPPLRDIQYADFSTGISLEQAAKLLSGLNDMFRTIPQTTVPSAPQNPSGKPAHAES